MKHSIQRTPFHSISLKNARDLYAEHEDKLEEYIERLLDWNEKINLVSRSVSRETVREHVIHSLIPVRSGLIDQHEEWIDSGSGGGLPGIPLAICCPEKRWILNDNVKKKMKATGEIVDQMKLSNISIRPESISLVDLKKGTGIVTKHAFKIKDLLRLLGSKPWTTIVMWKGMEGAEKEIALAKKKLNYNLYPFNFDGEEFYEGKGLIKIERPGH
ncbi:MAG: class I SAM-dependent methyltransferase [Balneolaceae bacterium]|nr:class I SAM-dependent methyltransferase [Balneolaceae bacterium]MCH8548746.1 class I SAM-dependent methyltransferase [Balneolaceae bacterium]